MMISPSTLSVGDPSKHISDIAGALQRNNKRTSVPQEQLAIAAMEPSNDFRASIYLRKIESKGRQR